MLPAFALLLLSSSQPTSMRCASRVLADLLIYWLEVIYVQCAGMQEYIIHALLGNHMRLSGRLLDISATRPTSSAMPSRSLISPSSQRSCTHSSLLPMLPTVLHSLMPCDGSTLALTNRSLRLSSELWR
jgi:hypothetical protein